MSEQQGPEDLEAVRAEVDRLKEEVEKLEAKPQKRARLRKVFAVVFIVIAVLAVLGRHARPVGPANGLQLESLPRRRRTARERSRDPGGARASTDAGRLHRHRRSSEGPGGDRRTCSETRVHRGTADLLVTGVRPGPSPEGPRERSVPAVLGEREHDPPEAGRGGARWEQRRPHGSGQPGGVQLPPAAERCAHAALRDAQRHPQPTDHAADDHRRHGPERGGGVAPDRARRHAPPDVRLRHAVPERRADVGPGRGVHLQQDADPRDRALHPRRRPWRWSSPRTVAGRCYSS